MFKYDEASEILDIEDSLICINCQECVKTAAKMDAEGAIEVGEMEDQFLFTVETAGQHRPEAIVEKALEVLSEKLDKTASEL